jgi:DNA polymerase-3 subunit beta
VFSAEGTTFVTVNGKEMLECIRRAELISREANRNPVRFTVDGDRELMIVESTTETGTFYEELGAEVDGLDLRISFSPRFMSDVFKAIDEERVRLMFTTPLSPCIVKGADSEDHKYLVLPLREMR